MTNPIEEMNAEDWSGMDGATALHLIDRHRQGCCHHLEGHAMTPSAEAKSCRPCKHCSRHGTCLEPEAAGLAERFVLVWAPKDFAKVCKAFERRSK